MQIRPFLLFGSAVRRGVGAHPPAAAVGGGGRDLAAQSGRRRCSAAGAGKGLPVAERFDLRSAFGTWLYKIAVNECWDYFRKKKVRRTVYEADLSEEQLRQMEVVPAHTGGASRSREDASDQAQQRQLLDRLLDELDDTDRSMLVMKEVSGFTVEEIGQVFGLNVNTVKVRMFRARGRLVEAYERRLKARPISRSS